MLWKYGGAFACAVVLIAGVLGIVTAFIAPGGDDIMPYLKMTTTCTGACAIGISICAYATIRSKDY